MVVGTGGPGSDLLSITMPYLADDQSQAASESGITQVHAAFRLFAQLWQEKSHGGVVELTAGERDKIAPDWWAPHLSRSTHGVFAIQSADGLYTVEAVKWDDVRRITIRKISELPEGVFE